MMWIEDDELASTALRLIGEALGDVFEYAEQTPDADHLRIAVMGQIRGILDMTEAMRKEAMSHAEREEVH